MVSKNFKKETEQVSEKEFQRLVRREKVIVATQQQRKAMVLTQFERVVEDTLPVDSIMGQFFDAQMAKAEAMLIRWSDDGLIETKDVKLKEMDEGLQKRILEVEDPEISLEDAYQMAIERVNVEMVEEGLPSPYEPEEGKTPLDLLKGEKFKAYYFWHIHKAFEKTSFWISNQTYNEQKAISEGEGQLVLDFWKAINAAHDYGDRFDHHEPPSPPNGDGGSPVTEWIGTVLGGRKPVLGS